MNLKAVIDTNVLVSDESDDGAKLVTGNQRHYPPAAFVVTPAEFCALIGM